MEGCDCSSVRVEECEGDQMLVDDAGALFGASHGSGEFPRATSCSGDVVRRLTSSRVSCCGVGGLYHAGFWLILLVADVYCCLRCWCMMTVGARNQTVNNADVKQQESTTALLDTQKYDFNRQQRRQQGGGRWE